MEQFADFFKLTGIDPALFGMGALLAIVLRYARGMLHWVGDGWTFGVAVAMAGFGAWLKMAEHESARTTGVNSLGLLAIILIVQYSLQQWAVTAKFIPKDNEWAQGQSNQGGK